MLLSSLVRSVINNICDALIFHISVREETDLEFLPFTIKNTNTLLTNIIQGSDSDAEHKGNQFDIKMSTFNDNRGTSVMTISKEQPSTCFDASSSFQDFQNIISEHGQICCTFVSTKKVISTLTYI